jgi:hypothetical protein
MDGDPDDVPKVTVKEVVLDAVTCHVRSVGCRRVTRGTIVEAIVGP